MPPRSLASLSESELAVMQSLDQGGNTVFRKASQADNSALINLGRSAPMVGAMTMVLDRSPDFFGLLRMQGTEHQVRVIEQNNAIVATSSLTKTPVRYHGKTINRAYSTDLRIHPKARGVHLTHVFGNLMPGVARDEMDCDTMFAEIHDKNKPALRIVEWVRKNIRPVVHGGMIHNYSLFPFRRYPVSRRYAIRPACIKDLPRLTQLLKTTYQDYSPAPIITEDELDRQLRLHPSFGIDCFRVAECQGQIVACAAFWDSVELRKTVVLKYNRIGSAIAKSLRYAPSFLSLPRAPVAGAPLHYLALRFPAHDPDHLDALRSIVHHESNMIRTKRHYHFIYAAFHEADRLRASIASMWRSNMLIHLFYMSLNPRTALCSEEEHRLRPAFVDGAVY